MPSIQTHYSNAMTFGSKGFSFATFNDPWKKILRVNSDCKTKQCIWKITLFII